MNRWQAEMATFSQKGKKILESEALFYNKQTVSLCITKTRLFKYIEQFTTKN